MQIDVVYACAIFPVTVRKGLAQGSKWTLGPYSSYWRGNTEMDVETAIRLHCSVLGGVCWDLGTHFGIYTVGMARAVSSKGRSQALSLIRSLSKDANITSGSTTFDWVTVYNAAASDAEGTGTLINSQGSGASTSHFAHEDERMSDDSPTVDVRTIILDNLVEKWRNPPSDFFKIEVEGHEAKAIKALSGRSLPIDLLQ